MEKTYFHELKLLELKNNHLSGIYGYRLTR